MRLDWKPKSVAFLDVETQSCADLREVTLSKYAKDSSTRLATCVVQLPDGQFWHYRRDEDPAEKLDELRTLAKEHTFVAHNAPFDAAILQNVLGIEATWFDTLMCARAAGLPGKLGSIGEVLGIGGKDPHGKRLIEMVCKVKCRGGKPDYVTGNKHLWDALLAYNITDVERLRDIYEQVKEFVEPEVMTVDRVINERGIPIDIDLLERLLLTYDENERRCKESFVELTDDVNPKSVPQVKAWLNRQGFAIKALNKVVLNDLLSNPEKFYSGDDEDCPGAVAALFDVLQLRRELTRVGRGKVDTAIRLLEDDCRIRDQHVYWGAHTGRWSGRALQIHNMPASHFKCDVDKLLDNLTYEACTAEVARVIVESGDKSDNTKLRAGVSDALNAMLRSMVCGDGDMLIADFSAVEARGVAWVADDPKLLAVFADPHRSVYIDFGTELYGRKIGKESDPTEYFIAKQIVLASGYGMGGSKFEHICTMRKLDLSSFRALGLTAQSCVKRFRETYPAVPAVWRAYDGAAKDAIMGKVVEAGKCTFCMDGQHLNVILPSGRRLVYRDARIEQLTPSWAKLQGLDIKQPTVTYANPHGYRGYLYGGRTCENIVQAVCRDLLAEALVHAEQAGLVPIMHVHDELICSSPRDRLGELLCLMTDPPKWARGFPVRAEGFAASRWCKKPPKGYPRGEAIGGRLL